MFTIYLANLDLSRFAKYVYLTVLGLLFSDTCNVQEYDIIIFKMHNKHLSLLLVGQANALPPVLHQANLIPEHVFILNSMLWNKVKH